MKLVSFSTYPLDVPRHGGQIRCNAINKSLMSNGWNVKHCCIYDPNGYPASDSDSDWRFPLTAADLAKINAAAGRTDVDACDGLQSDEDGSSACSG